MLPSECPCVLLGSFGAGKNCFHRSVPRTTEPKEICHPIPSSPPDLGKDHREPSVCPPGALPSLPQNLGWGRFLCSAQSLSPVARQGTHGSECCLDRAVPQCRAQQLACVYSCCTTQGPSGKIFLDTPVTELPARSHTWGEAQPPRTWSDEGGSALIVEAPHFLDGVDTRF